MSIFDLYPLLRPLLFRLDPETTHELTLKTLRATSSVPLLSKLASQKVPALPVRVMGIDFPNPLGLAAGLDKHGCCIDAFARMGFGFVEVGTVTPLAQPGNEKPRLFRLPEYEAIVNRMGFNSPGLNTVLRNIGKHRSNTIVGINIGKNAATPVDNAIDDYLIGLRGAYPLADYVTVNISSPNTKNLRDLQGEEKLDELLGALKQEQTVLAERHDRLVPIALKIAPDLDDEQIKVIAQLLRHHRFEGVIATNTTLSREAVAGHPLAHESGGLSGKPERAMSSAVVRALYAELQGDIPIIGVGGISSAEDAWEKMLAGADLVQVYSALIYQGPALVRKILAGLAGKIDQSGNQNLPKAVNTARS